MTTLASKVLSYEEARDHICNGDLLSFSKNAESSLWHRFTTRVLRSPFYHCGIAMWLTSNNGEKRLFICEAGNKRRIILLSTYSGLDFDVIKCPVDFNDIEFRLLDRVGIAKYSIRTYISVGLRFLFGFTSRDQSGEICSEMIQREYRQAGLHYLPLYDVLSPGELHDMLLSNGATLKFKVRG